MQTLISDACCCYQATAAVDVADAAAVGDGDADKYPLNLLRQHLHPPQQVVADNPNTGVDTGVWNDATDDDDVPVPNPAAAVVAAAGDDVERTLWNDDWEHWHTSALSMAVVVWQLQWWLSRDGCDVAAPSALSLETVVGVSTPHYCRHPNVYMNHRLSPHKCHHHDDVIPVCRVW